MFRLHVLGLPHTSTTPTYASCAYTARTAAFCSIMHERGHEVFLYGGPENTARVTEHIPIVKRREQDAWFPAYGPTRVFNEFDSASLPWRLFNERSVRAIRSRLQPGDIVCITMGVSHRAVADALGTAAVYLVEIGIGYSGVFAPHRVFESHAWRHYLAAKEPDDTLRWFDTVIPRGYTGEDVPALRDQPRQDFLFMGRLGTPRKGAQIAIDATGAVGATLLLAGPDPAATYPAHVRYLGVLTPEQRRVVMTGVRGVFMPTYYLEPGGGVALEAQLCGAPVITVPYGAMLETVIAGETGYHCAAFADFLAATVALLGCAANQVTIQQSAIERFGPEVTGRAFDAYFTKLQTLSGRGWYAV